MSNTPLIIVGTGDYAEVAFHYLQEDGNFDISGFAEEEAFINKRDFKGLPIYKVEELSSKFNGRDTKILVAVGPNKVNTVRERLYELIKSKGFSCISYIHP